MRPFRLTGFLLVLGHLASSPSWAATINVPARQPTLQAAVAAAASGDTILFAPGTYLGGVWLDNKSLVFASRYLTTGDTTYIAGTVLSGLATGYCPGDSACTGDATFDIGSHADGGAIIGLTITGAVKGVRTASVVDVRYCHIIGTQDALNYAPGSGGTLANNVIRNQTDDGIDLNGRLAVRIIDNLVLNNHEDGIEFRMYPYAGPTLDVVVIGNQFIGNGSDGIQLIDSPDTSSRRIRIERNVFAGNGKATIGCMPDQLTNEDYTGAPITERVEFINNTVVGDNYGIVGGANTVAVNNIFASIPNSAFRRMAGNSIAAHNLLWNNGLDNESSNVDVATTTRADPLLASDYRLKSGSPAIDAGVALFQWRGEAIVNLPPAAYAGSAPDLGTFEFSRSGPAITLERRVAGGNDDVEENAAGTMSLSSSDLELVYDAGVQKVGLRFANVSIPRGATITRAYVQFEAKEAHSEATALTIQGQAADNAATFTATAGNLSSRGRTAAAVSWAPVAWAAGEVGANQRTPDLSAVVQEVVSRGGWASGNGLALVVTGSGHRTAWAYEGKAAGAALLHIEAGGSAPPPANAAPVVDAGVSQTITLPAEAALNGTVTDDGQPSPPALATQWSVGSGPGPVGFGDETAVDTPASFTTAGTYVLRLTASDGALSATDSVTIVVNAAPPPGSITLERRVAGGSDDAEENAAGTVLLYSSDLELVYDAGVQKVGLRFANVSIPRGATITRAYVQFEAKEAQSEATTLTIQGQAADNAATFTATAGNLSSRGRTAAAVSWAPAAWAAGEVGANQRTPDLSGVLQEVVNRAGWASGNGLALVVTGSGHRTAWAYEGKAAGAALLHIEAGGSAPPPPANAAPVVDAGVSQTITLPSEAALNGTVTDDGQPSPPALTTQWSVGSGPGPVVFGEASAVDTRASFTTAGTYVLRLSASDGALSATDSVAIVVNTAPPAGSITLERRVAAGTDDAEENAAGTMSLSSSDLELVYDVGIQKVGLRFANVAIPRGATITRAYVQFEAKEGQSEATALTFQAQAADNAGTFTFGAGNVSSRGRTAASVSWAPVAWAAGEAGANQRTPDLSGVVQEVVNRAGWASGNALALVVTGSGHRTAWSFEGKAAGAALLHIEAGGGAPPPPANAAPVVDAGVSQTVALPAEAVLNGTVTDDGQPSPPALTTQWSVVSGPGPVGFADASAVDTQASFTTAGTYVLRLTASDGALSATDSVTIVVNAAPPPVSITLERRVSSVGTDDVEENAAGTVLLYSSDIELVYDTSVQKVGLRFTNVAIPRGTTITRAYVQFEAKEAQSEATTLTIQAQAADNAATFTATTGNVSSRGRTAAAVSWTPAAWAVGELGANQRTPDLSPVVQEVVNRSGWASGNALALVVTGSGHRTAWSSEGKAAGAALLHIEAGGSAPPPPANAAPVVDAGVSQTVALPAEAALNGTVTDDGQPSPPALTTQWSVVSGPGPVGFGDETAVDTPASFTTAGTYVLRLTASDGALSATDSVTIVVNAAPPPGSITLERRVAGGSDDAEENAAGTVLLYSSDIELVYDAGVQKIGLRFANVAIPRGATITRAYVQFEAKEAQSEATALTIQGQAADNAATFTATAGNLSSRGRTAAAVSWAPVAWGVGEVGANQRTPDLSGVLQEVVSRAGWASGNGLAFVVTGSGHRTAWAYEGKAAGAALLHVEASGPVAPSQEMSAALEERPRYGFALHGVLPVPARDVLSVEFSLGEGERAKLEVLDVSGRRVAAREVGPAGPGRHRIQVGDRLPAGVYFVRLTQGRRVGVVKALVVK